MKIFKDLDVGSMIRAMKGMNEAPEVKKAKPARKETGLERNRRRQKKHRKTINRIAAESRRRNRCG